MKQLSENELKDLQKFADGLDRQYGQITADIGYLIEELKLLRKVQLTIDTPNEVCDGYVTDTIENLIDTYGPQCLEWGVESDHVLYLERKINELMDGRDFMNKTFLGM